jgi:hypothetical protein
MKDDLRLPENSVLRQRSYFENAEIIVEAKRRTSMDGAA